MKRMLLFFLLLLTLPVALTGYGKSRVTDIYRQLDRRSSKTLYQNAYHYIMEGDNDKALVCYSIIVERMTPDDTATVRLAVGAMGNSAYIYSVHEFGKSFVCLDKAIKTAEQYGITDKLPFLYLNMANLLRANETVRTPDHLSATVIGYYRRSFLAARAVQDWDVLLTAFNNVVSLAIGCKQLGDVKGFLVDFRTLRMPRHTPGLPFSRLHDSAAIALLHGDRRKAQAALDSMLRQPDCAKDVRVRLMVLSDKASIAFYDHDYPQCIALAQQAIGLSQRHNERDVTVSFYDILAKCFLAMGDKARYRMAHNLYLEQKDSLYYQNKLLDVEHLKFTSDLEGVKAKMQVISLEREKQRIVVWAASFVALLALTVLVTVVVSYRRVRRKNWMLFLRYQQLMEEHGRKQQMMRKYEREIEELKTHQTQQYNGESGASTEQKYKYNHIDESTKDVIMSRILKVLDDTEEICKDTFSVQRLSEMVGWKHNYVAQVIGDRFNKNFNTILAEYRIRVACQRLQDTDHYGHYTIEGIAQSVGYKSRSSFARVFKRITGLSPSAYAKMAAEKGNAVG